MQNNIFLYKFYYQWWKNIDKSIFSIISLLFVIGLFFSLVSTSLIASDKLDTNSYFFFFKHLIYIFIGIFIIFIVDFIMRKLLINAFTVFAHRSKSKFDNILVKNKVTRNIAHIIPLIIAIELIPSVFIDFDYFENIIEKGLQVYAIVLTLWIVRSVFNSIKDYLKT